MAANLNKSIQSTDRTPRVIQLDYFAFLLMSTVLTATSGADHHAYFAWASYFASFDLSALSSFPRSATGAPLVLWSYGAGLLASIPNFLLREEAALPIPLVAALLGVSNVALVLYLAKRQRWMSPELVMAGVILFTPAGFYLNKYCSESWTVLLVLSGLATIECGRRHPNASRYVFALIIGIVTYLLLLIKAVNIALCVGLFVVFIALNVPTPLFSGRNFRTLFSLSSVLAVAPIFWFALLSAYNKVANGDFFSSSYSYGDAQFTPLSLHQLKLVEVLFSSWHGLFFYHPLVALVVFWLCRELVLRRHSSSDPEFWIIASIVAAFGFQVLIQSAWFVWWMGLGTFGARGFAGVSILLVYGLFHCNPPRPEIKKWLLRVAACLAAFEAYLLSIGQTNFVNYHAFVLSLLAPESFSLLLLIMFLTVTLAALGRSKQVILGMSLLPGIVNVTPNPNYIPALVAAIIVLACQAPWLRDSLRPTFSLSMLTVVAVMVFSISVILQIRLLRDLHIAGSHQLQEGKKFDCTELRDTYREYTMISGYKKEKAAFHDFLSRQNCFNQN
jgi:hypothetical protein